MDRFTEDYPPIARTPRPPCCPKANCLEPVADDETQVTDVDGTWHLTCWQMAHDDEPEPECSCHQTDVDLFDARGCELHDSRSGWNYRQSLHLVTEEVA